MSPLVDRLGAWAAATADAVRPWTRPQHWTIANLKGAAREARRHPRRTLIVLGILTLCLAMVAGVAPGRNGDQPLAEVREGPFRVAIVETGTLQAVRSMTYASSIPSNQAKIVALAPEGKLVQKGDLLILFDAAPFEEEIRRSQAALAQAQAELQKAQQELRLQEIQNLEEVAAGRQRTERSELELRDVQQGKGRLKEEEATAAVANAERELQKAETAFEDLKPLLAEGFITKLELERAAQQTEKAREDLELARRRRAALLDFGRPLEVSQAQAEALSTKESLKQLEAAAGHKLEQKKAAIRAAESRIQDAASRLALAQQQLARTEVRADVPGIVVYTDVFFGSERRKPQVGDQVWSNQPLLILPDVSQMAVEVKVRETDIHKVDRNQKVGIRVDAYPSLRLAGSVALLGTLAQEDRERRGAKFFTVSIHIKESDPRLRPGMTARVEIDVEERQRAIFVPLDAVFERDGRRLCYVAATLGWDAREVVLGPANQDFVVVEKGLLPGDRVFLYDPAAASTSSGG